MLFEYAIDPATVIEWARDNRSFQQFKNAFGYGQPRLISNFPKRKKWRRLVKSLISEDFSTIELKRVEVILTAFKGQTVVERDGPEYDGTKCWSSNILGQHAWIKFNHLFVAKDTHCADEAAFTIPDTYRRSKGCWQHERQHLIRRQADEVAATIGNMLRLSDRLIIVDPFFRAEHGQKAILRKLAEKMLTGRPHQIVPVVEIIYSLEARGAQRPEDVHRELSSEIEVGIFAQVELIVHALVNAKMHNRYLLTEHGGVTFGHSISEDLEATDEVTLLSADVYDTRWAEYAERRLPGEFQTYPVLTDI